MTDQIRVLLVDDDEVIRSSFRALIGNASDMTVVGEASNGVDAVALVAELMPDVVLMDIRMPGMDGLAATRTICSASRKPRIIVLTMFDLDDYVYEAIQAGASGFLLKNSLPEDIVRGIRVVAEGNALLAPEVTRMLISRVVSQGTPPPRRVALPELTAREREVVALIGQGLSNDEIAAELFLTRATVRTYASRLLTKLQARDRAQLVVMAYESGLVRVSR